MIVVVEVLSEAPVVVRTLHCRLTKDVKIWGDGGGGGCCTPSGPRFVAAVLGVWTISAEVFNTLRGKADRVRGSDGR